MTYYFKAIHANNDVLYWLLDNGINFKTYHFAGAQILQIDNSEEENDLLLNLRWSNRLGRYDDSNEPEGYT